MIVRCFRPHQYRYLRSANNSTHVQSKRLLSTGSGPAKESTKSKERLIPVPESRLKELMHAEIGYLETVPSRALSLNDVFETRNPYSQAKFIQADNPKRLAFRIRLIEGLSCWTQVPELTEIHAHLNSSYQNIRLVKRGPAYPFEEFVACIKESRRGGRETVLNLSKGMSKVKEIAGDQYNNDFVSKWMDSFFLSRIGSNMLLDQFVACASKAHGGLGRRSGIIDTKCDPTAICMRTARQVSSLCSRSTGQKPSFSIETYKAGSIGPLTDGTHARFSYVPEYLAYIMRELLKNSFNATVKNAADKADMGNRPIKILVSSDDHRIFIRVSDQAGGIPSEVADRMWSYLHGAAAKPGQSAGPLAGYGVGLPLSRLHACYLGGQLEVRSFPGFGTDAYLSLPRLATDQVEEIPHMHVHAEGRIDQPENVLKSHANSLSLPEP